MSRIAPNLSKDQFDVSPLGNESPKTNRQHLRVPISARGIRFGTLSIPKPHNRILQTYGYSGSGPMPYPLPPSEEIQQEFASSEAWTRNPPSNICPNFGTVTRQYFSNQGNSKDWPWRGSALIGSFPNNYFWQDPPDAYSNRPNSALEFTYPRLSDGQYVASNEPSIAVPIIRDDVAGVATIGTTSSWGASSTWSANQFRSYPFSYLLHPVAIPGVFQFLTSLGFSGRFWVTTQIDRYGNLENTFETRTYQFMHDRDAGQSYVRRRFAWVDSLGGVKELRLMTREKTIRFSTFVVQTWRRQWIDNGAGGAIPIPSGATAVQHRTATNAVNFAGDAIRSQPYVAWIAGEYPGHSTFSLTAFEAAVTSGDAATVATMASNWTGSYVDAPVKSQYKWHQLRWLVENPTWGGAKRRMLGYSERVGNNIQTGCALGWNARLFTTATEDDCEITYPFSSSVTVAEREAESVSIYADEMRTAATLIEVPATANESPGLTVANFSRHPLSPVTTIDSIEKYDRLRVRTTTRTASPAMSASPIVTIPQWQWKGLERLDGTVYRPLSPRIRLSRVYGPYGQADATLTEFPMGTVPARTVGGGTGTAHYTYFMMYNSTRRMDESFPIPVEGWHGNAKPTVTPSPIVLTMTNPATDAIAVITVSDANLGQRINLFVCSMVIGSGQAFLPKNLRIRITPIGTPTNMSASFNLSAEHHAMTQPGSFSFTVRAFDGWEYSDPIPITVNVLPPPPP